MLIGRMAGSLRIGRVGEGGRGGARRRFAPRHACVEEVALFIFFIADGFRGKIRSLTAAAVLSFFIVSC